MIDKIRRCALALCGCLVLLPSLASAALTITPITWNVIGLDSNNVAVGPNEFPVGVRVCNNAAAVSPTVNFVWDDGADAYSGNPYINLRTGSLSAVTLSIADGTASPVCADAYFNIFVTRIAGSYNKTRRYHVTASAAGVAQVSTPVPRELFVEHLVSQNRNYTNTISYSSDGSNFTSVSAGGAMNMAVGGTYWIKLTGTTATQGYNQLESFLTMPNNVYQVLSTSTTYTAAPAGGTPTTTLYGDACGWDNSPASPSYRSCIVSDYKNGGGVTNTYKVTILSKPGSQSGGMGLAPMIYDFSGSSYHYNSDYSVAAISFNIASPTMAKAFAPKTINAGGTSKLSFTINNPSASMVSGINFTDTFPAGMTLSASPTVSYSSCGTPAPSTLTAGASSLSFSNIQIAAGATCTITVTSVTASTVQSYVNTTGHLFVGTTDTGSTGTDTLIVQSAPTVTPPSSCTSPVTIAQWTFDTNTQTTSPPPTSVLSGVTGVTSANVLTGSAYTTTNGITTYAWGVSAPWTQTSGTAPGVGSTVPYFQFKLTTANYGGLSIGYRARLPSAGWGSAQGYTYVYSSSDGTNWTLRSSLTAAYQIDKSQTVWYPTAGAYTGTTTSTGGDTYFRITFDSSGPSTAGALIDNVAITGCPAANVPTLSKAFSPTSIPPIPSTLTFTVTNPNSSSLTNVSFADVLPDGLVVANPNGLTAPSCSANGSMSNQTITALAGSNSISLSGATMAMTSPATSVTCTFSVNVTGSVAGLFHNVTSSVRSAETGANTTATGYGAADLTVTAVPPVISKAFGSTSILTNGTTTLTFNITNPNSGTTLSGVAFTDSLPSGLLVASSPGLTNTCGGTATATAGSGSVSLSGATLAGGASCSISVSVQGTTVGTKTNSVTVTSTTAGTGNTSSAVVAVRDPVPGLRLLKQVSLSATGPWSTFLTVPTPLPKNVYFQFTVENTGDTALTNVNVNELTLPGLDLSACSTALSGGLAVQQTVSCIAGPVTVSTVGAYSNTANATSATATAPNSTVQYSSAGLLLTKNVGQTSFSSAGEVLTYTYNVYNNGGAALLGPVTVTDDKTTVTCPAVSTVGNGDDNLDPGEGLTCTASYTVTATDVSNGYVANIATATVDGTSANSSTRTVLKAGVPDMAVALNLPTYRSPSKVQRPNQSPVTVAIAGQITCTNVGIGAAVNPICSVMASNAASVTLSNCSLNGVSQGQTTTPPASMNAGDSFACRFSFDSPDNGADSTVSASGSRAVTLTGTTGADSDSNANNNTTQPMVKIVDAINDASVTVARSLGGHISLLSNDKVGDANATLSTQSLSPQTGRKIAMAVGDKVGITATILATVGNLSEVTLLSVLCPDGTSGASATCLSYVSLDSSTGVLTVLPDAPEGAYTVTYQDCATNPEPYSTVEACDTATSDFVVSASPTLALVSGLKAYVDAGQVWVEWETSEQVGTAGFNLLRATAQRGMVQVNRELVPAVPWTSAGAVYRIVDPDAQPGVVYTYAVEEVETAGAKAVRGVYTVSVGLSANTVLTSALTSAQRAAGVQTSARVGSTRTVQTVTAPKVASSAASSVTANAVRIVVAEDALYVVSTQQVATALGATDAKVRQWLRSGQLLLSNRGQAVALKADPAGDRFYFYGRAPQGQDAVYTRNNVYVLSNARGLQMAEVDGAAPNPNESTTASVATVRREQNIYPVMYNTLDPDTDFWYWGFASANQPGARGAPVAFAVSAPVPVQTGQATVVARLKGATAMAPVGNVDHIAHLWVNGSEVTPAGGVPFKGYDRAAVTASFDAALLREDGNNTIEVQDELPVGVAYSALLVDAFDLSYPRRHEASGDVLQLQATANAIMTVSGFTATGIGVADISDATRPVWVKNTTVASSGSAPSVSFVAGTNTGASEGSYVVALPQAPVAVQGMVAGGLLTERKGASYVVVAPATLSTGAAALAAYRGGMLVDLQDVYDTFADGLSNPYAIRDFLEHAAQNWRIKPLYVALVGKGSFDVKDHKGLQTNLLPTLMVPTPDGLFPTDMRYVDFNGDGVPQMALGRIPAYGNSDVSNYVTKVRTYESTQPASSSVVLVADLPDGAGDFTTDSSEVAAALRTQSYAVDADSEIYRQYLTVETARAALMKKINDPAGVALFNYIGHGSNTVLGKQSLLSTYPAPGDAALFKNAQRQPVFTAFACQVANGFYPGVDSMAEALLWSTQGGVVLTFASTGLSMNYEAHKLNLSLVKALGAPGSRPVFGAAARAAMADYAAQGLPQYLLNIYQTIGDPALRMQ